MTRLLLVAAVVAVLAAAEAAEMGGWVVADARRVNSFLVLVLVSVLGGLGFGQSRRLSFYGRRLV